jgi:DNA-binding IclR family transcriptional regulator
MEKSGETTNLVIEDKDQAVYIEQAECKSYLRTANKVGSRAPLHCTAAGKIILASRPLQERKKYLESVSLVPLTSETITDKGELLLELEEISKRHIAVDNEEQMIGERCLAVPVFNQTGETIAAISVSGPNSRLTSKRMKELKPIIQGVGLKISREMGFEK